jgi:glycosyltransferase involved in cell wall biosynthesis
VNDSSTDNSQAILDEYAAKDSRIKNIIHDRNRGLSAARNTGMEAAAGDYIYFLDSDDWIDDDYLEKMTGALENNCVEVVLNVNVLCFIDSLEDISFDVKQFHNKYASGRYGEESLKSLVQNYPMTVCYLFTRDFLKKADIKFPEGLRHEDCYFSWAMLPNVKNLYVIDNSCYHYRKREDSIMGFHNEPIRYYDMVAIVARIYEYYKTRHFVDRYALPFSVLGGNLKRHAHPEEFFDRMKRLIHTIQQEGLLRETLYDPDELLLYSSKTYEDFMMLDRQISKKRMVNKLRLGLMKKSN